MPQEFHVLRCYECETFQVHIVKKSKKWDCKMCGAKQSLKKAYFCGTGKQCRLHVQALNEQRIITDSLRNTQNQSFNEDEENETSFEKIDPQNSKWNEFLVQEEDNSEPEAENSGMTFERQTKRRKFNKNKTLVENEDFMNNDSFDTPAEKTVKNNINSQKESKWNSFVTENNCDSEKTINCFKPPKIKVELFYFKRIRRRRRNL